MRYAGSSCQSYNPEYACVHTPYTCPLVLPPSPWSQLVVLAVPVAVPRMSQTLDNQSFL